MATIENTLIQQLELKWRRKYVRCVTLCTLWIFDLGLVLFCQDCSAACDGVLTSRKIDLVLVANLLQEF